MTVIELAVEARRAAEIPRLLDELNAFVRADPEFEFAHDAESGLIVIKGISERQLDEKVGALLNLGLALDLGAPQVSYRETISRPVTVDYTHKRWTEGRGEFARVIIVIEPAPGRGNAFRVTDASLKPGYVTAAARGCETALESGPLGGFPVIDLRIRLIDGASHEHDSSPQAFEVAGRAALREALVKGGPVMLEPIMRVRIVTPQDCAGPVVEGLKARRGQMLGQEMREAHVVIEADVSCANLLGFEAELAASSRKRAKYEVRFSRYVPVPAPPENEPFPPAIGMRA